MVSDAHCKAHCNKWNCHTSEKNMQIPAPLKLCELTLPALFQSPTPIWPPFPVSSH